MRRSTGDLDDQAAPAATGVAVGDRVLPAVVAGRGVVGDNRIVDRDDCRAADHHRREIDAPLDTDARTTPQLDACVVDGERLGASEAVLLEEQGDAAGPSEDECRRMLWPLDRSPNGAAR